MVAGTLDILASFREAVKRRQQNEKAGELHFYILAGKGHDVRGKISKDKQVVATILG